tara:strand:+ start:238 stop:1080 length:843 start_codon:yes stop_codon:yes gene_type:complete
MKYKNGIDFIIVSYCKHDFVRLCVESINKYIGEIEHTINVVVNYLDKDKEIEIHKRLFKDNPNVKVIEGVDQSKTTNIGNNGEFTQTKTWVGKIDGCIVASGSKYAELANTIGIKKGNRKHICVLDQDTILLNSCFKDLMYLSEEYFFISNRWDPGNIFSNCKNPLPELGMARAIFWFSKRSIFEKNNLYPTCDYRDAWGNITYFAQQNNLKFLVLENSYRDRFRSNNGLWKEHSLNINHLYSEQAWLNKTPLVFHYGRGGYRKESDLIKWVKEAENYLK